MQSQAATLERWGSWKAYAMAVLAVAAAAGVRALLDPLMGDVLPFPTFFCAILIAIWFGGFRAGLLALILGLFVADFLFVPPRWEFVFQGFALKSAVGNLAYLLTGLLICIVGDAMARGVAPWQRKEAIKLRPVRQPAQAVLFNHAVAVLAVGIALVVRLAVFEQFRWPPGAMVFALFAVTVSALQGGIGPGLFAVVLAAILYATFDFEPIGQLAIASSHDVGSLTAFIFTGTLIAVVVGRARSLRRVAEAARDRLRHELHAKSRLQELSAVLIQGGDLKPLLQAILAAAAELTGTDKGNIQIYNPEKRTLSIFVHQGLGLRFVEHFAEDGWAATCSEAAGTRQRVILEDVRKLDHLRSTVELEIVLEDGIRAIQSTPLLSREGVLLGMLNNHYRAPGRPDEDKLRIIDLLARQAADLLERKQSEARIAADLEAMTTLQTIGNLCVSSADESSDCLREILDAAIAFTQSAKGNIQLFGSESGALEIAAQRGFEEPFLKYFEHVSPEKASACGAAMQAGERVVVEDVTRSELFRGQPSLDVLLQAGVRAVQSTPLLTGSGKLLGMISTHFSAPHRPNERELRFMDLLARLAADYVERKRTEEALHLSEERFQTLANGSPVLLWVNGLEGCEFVNREYLQFLGLEKDLQVLGYDWSGYVHPDDREGYLAAYVKAFEAATSFGAEFRFRRHDGQYRWMRSEGTPRRAPDGSLLGYVGASIDITARREAETALHASEESSRMLVSVLTDVPWTTDAEGRFAKPQLAWTVYTGQCWEESRDFGWANALHPQDREQIRTIWQHACETRSYRAQGRLWHAPSGQYRHFEARAMPLFHPDGSVREWVGAFTDIEDQKRLETELRESDRHKDEFLAMLAHELRNPLAPIRNSLALLRLGEAESATMKTALAILERQVSQMVHLVDDLLDLNRVKRGKIRLRLEKLELGSVVKDAVEAVLPAARARNLDLAVKVSAEPMYVSGDSTRLAQVVGNLLSNACKFTEPGGRVGIAVDSVDHQAVIRVHDSGIGLAADQMDRVFDLFTQSHTALEQSQGGLGIGLALVKTLTEMHGGTVEVRSAGPGKGSEFIVRLPTLSEIGQPLQPEAEPKLPKTARKCRILIVDDNQDSADSLALLLKLAGHETHTTYDGLTALEAAATVRPEVILLDIGLPDLNGYEVAHTLRAKPWGKNIVLLALTGWGQPEDKLRSQESGFDGHLVKPVEVASLMEILGSLSRQEQSQIAKSG